MIMMGVSSRFSNFLSVFFVVHDHRSLLARGFQFQSASAQFHPNYSFLLHEHENEHEHGNPSANLNSVPNPYTSSTIKLYPQEEAIEIIGSTLFTSSELGTRIRIGRDAMGLTAGEALSNNDKRNFFTYGEFPLESFDELFHRAIQHFYERNDHDQSKPIKIVDVGSGCGRLLMHAALNSEYSSSKLDIHGVEISSEMHEYACRIVDRGVEQGLFQQTESKDQNHNYNNDDTTPATCTRTQMTLHNGSAQDLSHIFSDADIIFAYCSVWETGGFAIEERAMLMGRDMTDALAKSCKHGCVAVMTDRLLLDEGSVGWEYVDSLEVENPDLLGSTGYFSILNK